MSAHVLFRSPTSRGLLSGLLAGIAELIAYYIGEKYTLDSTTAYMLFWCCESGLSALLLIGLPAILAKRRIDFLSMLLLQIFAFLFVFQWIPVFAIQTVAIPAVQYVSLVQQVAAEITSGVFLGTVLVKAYGRPDLRYRAMLWGALGGVPNAVSSVAISVSYMLDSGPLFTKQGTATLVISLMMTNILLGVIAAVPFDCAPTSNS